MKLKDLESMKKTEEKYYELMYFDFQDKCMGFFENILSPSDHAWLQRINFLRKNYLTVFLERIYNFFFLCEYM